MDLSPFAISATPYLTAFLAGLFGGVHCIGMCGGIVGALIYGLPPTVRQRPAAVLRYALAYNAGRIASYVTAGIIVGYLGYRAGDMLAQYQGWIYLRVLAALFMIALGLYLGGWWFGLTQLERLGSRVWAQLKPLGQRLFPIRHTGQALLLGLVWGWLPCGLVYSMLVFAFAAGGWREGATFMLSFGLGTLPTLLALGVASARLSRALQKPTVRHLAGLVVIVFGAWTLAATLVYQPNVGLGCRVPPP